MRIGLITEGLPDQAVIKNIIHAHIEDFNFDPIRPIDLVDETDIYKKNNAAAGGFARVKKDCEEQTLFQNFFALEIGGRKNLMIIQLDTAEVDNFNIVRPAKKDNRNYVQEVRGNVIEKVKEWLNDSSFDEQIIYAISVEELEAWMLTIYDNGNSVSSMNPKSKLKGILRKKNKSRSETFENYSDLSKDFKKKKKLIGFCKRNESLLLFVQDLETKIHIEEEE